MTRSRANPVLLVHEWGEDSSLQAMPQFGIFETILRWVGEV